MSDENNPYKPPQAHVEDVESGAEKLFYVVSPSKFLIMMIGTLGIYQVYWFYKNWSLLNEKHKSYWPVARAIFAIFFTHALFNEVDGALKKRQKAHAWSPGMLATVFVVSSIASQVLGRLARMDFGSPMLGLVTYALFVPIIWSLYQAQKAINVAEDDLLGEQNDGITAANVIWLVIGGLLWLLLLVGLYITVFGGATTTIKGPVG